MCYAPLTPFSFCCTVVPYLQNYGLVLACFSLSCSPGAISLSRVAFHMESEKHTVSSPWTRRSGIKAFFASSDRKESESVVEFAIVVGEIDHVHKPKAMKHVMYFAWLKFIVKRISPYLNLELYCDTIHCDVLNENFVRKSQK